MKTVIGLFDYASDAYAAQADLLGSGVEKSQISVLTNPTNDQFATIDHTENAQRRVDVDNTEAAEGAAGGATAGALAGGAAGLLASLGLLAIPGIGPLLAAGPIVTILTGAGIGAAAGGLVGGLIGLGIPENEAEVYAEGLTRGGILLTVESPDVDADRIAAVLSQHNAVDIDKRAAEWETAGWQRKYPTPRSATGSTGTVDARSRGQERVGTGGETGGEIGGGEATGLPRTTAARIYNPR